MIEQQPVQATGAGGERLTPDAFAARLRQAPPDGLELPDGVTLTGASLEAFLESGHFPYGRYRIGLQTFYITPSPGLEPALLERLVRSGSGQQPVGSDLLVWRRASFHVAAGTASEQRQARPFVGASGARAYLWLGRPLPGGPLVLRDANGVEERVTVDAAEPPTPVGLNTETRRHGDSTGEAADEIAEAERDDQVIRSGTREAGVGLQVITPPPQHPLLHRAEAALQQGDTDTAGRCLRELMARSGIRGDVLAAAGWLWQRLGQWELAEAAFRMALERGSVEGALGLSSLAEGTDKGIEAAMRALDEAVARNLRSPELHARYAELLEREGQTAQAAWHRRQIHGARWSQTT